MPFNPFLNDTVFFFSRVNDTHQKFRRENVSCSTASGSTDWFALRHDPIDPYCFFCFSFCQFYPSLHLKFTLIITRKSPFLSISLWSCRCFLDSERLGFQIPSNSNSNSNGSSPVISVGYTNVSVLYRHCKPLHTPTSKSTHY